MKHGSTLVLADDTLSMAQHAVEQGWIRTEALSEIGAEKEEDEGPPGLVERLLGTEDEPGADSVTISGGPGGANRS